MTIIRSGRLRRTSALVLAAALSATLSACDDNNGGGGGANNNPTPTRTNTPLPTNTVPPGSTATPTSPSTGPTRTATATPQANQETVAKLEAVIAGVLPSVLDLQSFGGLAGGGIPRSGRGGLPDVTAPCPAGGTLTFSCNTSGSRSTTEIDFNNCRIGATGVPSTFIDGTFKQTVQAPCFSPPPPNSAIGVEFRGTIQTSDPNTGEPISVEVDMGLTVQNDANGTRLDFDGTVDSCVGPVKVKTLQTIVIPNGASCPTAGRIEVTLGSEKHIVTYESNGGVSIDVGGDGSVDEVLANCQDADTSACN